MGMLAKITSAISKAGGDIGALDIIDISKGLITRDISVAARDKDHSQNIVSRAAQIPGIHIVNVADRIVQLHLGGKIEVSNKVPLKTRDECGRLAHLLEYQGRG
jgi:malate dehydrogenase (oxaloacetate-decarboxylating)